MTMNPISPLYDLQGVTRAFRQGAEEILAVNDVDLKIHAGEFLVVAGPSGSGKTTLLQLLGGLDRPTEGKLLFEGRDMARLGDGTLTRMRLETFGFVFQQFNLIPTLTARENVEAALAPTRLATARRRSLADVLLDSVGLAGRATHLPSRLSGGEQQRVAIARALANEPQVLLADEPTGNLDVANGREVLSVLRDVAAEQGRAVVLITHDPSIAQTATRLVRMRDGRIEPAGGSFGDPLFAEAGPMHH
jgi:putative ABC transport system ATP-binding protein